MKDRFEKFVSENRESFDLETPNDRVWKGVQREISGKRASTSGFWMWKAAAVFFFFLSAFLLLNDFLINSERAGKLTGNTDQFIETENYYTSLISLKEQELDNYADNVDFDYMAQLGNLNAIYQVLKTELEKDPSQPVIDALILNLISRVDILNRELDRLEKMQEDEALEERTATQS